MTTSRSLAAAALAVALVLSAPRVGAQKPPTPADFLSPGYPFDLVSAKKTDRIAWLAYEEGKRNVYTAVSPGFVPARLTSFLDDDGTEISDLALSDDGALAVFVRGTAPNREGWVANPTGNPSGAERAIWAVRTGAAPATAGRATGAGTASTTTTPRPAAGRDSRWRGMARRRGRQSRARTGRQLSPVRARRPDFLREARHRRAAGADVPRRRAADKGVGHEQRPALVTRRLEDRVRQQSRRPQLHRRLRRRRANGEIPVAERRSRHQPDVVARQQARRVHSSSRTAVRPAGAARDWQPRFAQRAGVQPQRRRPRTRRSRRWTRRPAGGDCAADDNNRATRGADTTSGSAANRTRDSATASESARQSATTGTRQQPGARQSARTRQSARAAARISPRSARTATGNTAA